MFVVMTAFHSIHFHFMSTSLTELARDVEAISQGRSDCLSLLPRFRECRAFSSFVRDPLRTLYGTRCPPWTVMMGWLQLDKTSRIESDSEWDWHGETVGWRRRAIRISWSPCRSYSTWTARSSRNTTPATLLSWSEFVWASPSTIPTSLLSYTPCSASTSAFFY